MNSLTSYRRELIPFSNALVSAAATFDCLECGSGVRLEGGLHSWVPQDCNIGEAIHGSPLPRHYTDRRLKYTPPQTSCERCLLASPGLLVLGAGFGFGTHIAGVPNTRFCHTCYSLLGTGLHSRRRVVGDQSFIFCSPSLTLLEGLMLKR